MYKKEKKCKYFQLWGENVKICDYFLMFKIFFNKDLLNVLMVKLQTVDIDLGHTGLSFFQLARNMSRDTTSAYHVIQNCHGKCKQSTFHTSSKQIR